MAYYIGQPAAACACAPAEAQIRRFHSSVRRRLRALTWDAPRVSDLLFTHPGAAFVLVAGDRTPDGRGKALRLVKAGVPLAEVDAVLDLPRWLRRLPPEAFVKPVRTLPGGTDFGRRIVHRIPGYASLAASWLERLTVCTEVCDSDMALWLASKTLCDECCTNNRALRPLGAFVWFSQHSEHFAHRLIEEPWHSRMRFKTAVAAAHAWLARLLFACCGDGGGADGSWYKERKSHGYRFRPLRTEAELEEEGKRMKHCVGGYTGRVIAGACLIYSIRRRNSRVATMEVVPVRGKERGAGIAQIKGERNATPDGDVFRAANAWLARRGRYPFAGMARSLNEGRWREVWRPYCEAKPLGAPYCFGRQEDVLARLHADLNALGRWHEE